MRAAPKRSSLVGGADIRTTGFVQLDSSRPEKRPRCDDWPSFQNNFNSSEAQLNIASLEGKYLSEEQIAPDKATDTKEESLNLCLKPEENQLVGSTPNQMCKEPPNGLSLEIPPEKKSLRHFSRKRNPKSHRCSETPPQQGTDKSCEALDASSSGNNIASHTEVAMTGCNSINAVDMMCNRTMDKLVVSNGVEAGVSRSKAGTPISVIDLHQLPEDMKCIEDDEMIDAKPRTEEREIKQECSISGSIGHCKDKLEMIEDCLNFLEQFGLFKDKCIVEDSCTTAEVPGFVGDGIISMNCKVCGRPEDVSGTLVCDICEETFHIPCCYPKIRSIPRDDRWFCSFCTRKRKRKSAELKIYSAGHSEEKVPANWKIDKTKIRGWDLQRMERTHVRIGFEFQAEVPQWSEKLCFENLRADYPGLEAPRTLEDKQKEKELAEHNLANQIWPMGWLPAKQLPEGEKENWIQCQNLVYEEGDILPDGQVVAKDIVCGKWRRAPLHIIADDGWECSCTIVWDPRHADCAVPQEIPTEEIRKRPKARMQAPSEL